MRRRRPLEGLCLLLILCAPALPAAETDDLVTLAGGKPLVLGEVGNPPTLEILEKQPLWAMYVVWAGMARGTSRDRYSTHMDSPRVLHLEDRAYWSAITPLRKAAGLPERWADHVHLDWRETGWTSPGSGSSSRRGASRGPAAPCCRGYSRSTTTTTR